MTAQQKLKPSILCIGKVQYSVTIMGIWGSTDTTNVYYVWHVIVRAANPTEAEELAVKLVKEYVIDTGGIDGLTSLSAVAIIPGRHPNLMEGLQSIPGEDSGFEEDEQG